MGFDEKLVHFGALIEEEISKLFSVEISKAEAYHPFIGETFKFFRDYVFRHGKRLASVSTLMTYKGYKGSIDERILRACVGIEIYRHAILVHDDLVDNDDMRRGEPAVHKAFEQLAKERYGRFLRFGEGIAVFAGDILFALALKAISAAGFEEDLTSRVIKNVIKDFQFVNESQILDLLFEFSQPGLKEWEIMASKRASNLFKTTMLSGAIFAKGSEEELRTIEDCSSHIGFAFDIQDDIIGTFASDEVYGRPTTGDIIAGKKPLHVVLALREAPSIEKKRLLEILTATHNTEEEIAEAKNILREHGLNEAKRISRSHAKKALDLLGKLSFNEETKKFFASFIEYVAESLDWYT